VPQLVLAETSPVEKTPALVARQVFRLVESGMYHNRSGVTRAHAPQQVLPRPAAAGPAEVALSEVELLEEVGGGNFGVVHRALWRGRPAALKRCRPANGKERSGREQEQREQDFLAEIRLTRALAHPNIAACLGACTAPGAGLGPCLLTEFYAGGSLEGFLHGGPGQSPAAPLGAVAVRGLAADVCRGMGYLHGFRPPVRRARLRNLSSKFV
jgi:hypothetical protein